MSDRFKNIKDHMSSMAIVVEDFLNDYFQDDKTFASTLISSERYSLLAGGKRLRAILVLTVYELFRGRYQDALPFAASVEMVHTYSLIHDDLPAMDNDDYRRGKLTNHKVYGEAVAILAGDGLLTKAFELASDKTFGDKISDSARLEVINILAVGAGDKGMIAGQVADILSTDKDSVVTEDLVKFIHKNKTSALIEASVKIGAILAGADSKQLDILSTYAKNIGLAFQVTDDILDITSSKESLGKSIGKDIEQNKATYPKIFGLEKSIAIADELVHEAKSQLDYFGSDSQMLKNLADFITARGN